jgi:hypothetical protein
MPLVPSSLFLTLYPQIQKAAEEAMLLTLRGLDPLDKEKNIELSFGFDENIVPPKKISVDCSKGANPVGNINAPNDTTVDTAKAAELFGVAFSAKLTPVLCRQMASYIKTATITIPKGQGVIGTGYNGFQLTGGITKNTSPSAIII